MCLTTKAVPKSAARLRRSLRASNVENWFCHRVQRKKNESIQRRSPASGRTELNACADAQKMHASVSACETFESAANPEEGQLPKTPARPRTKSASSIEASISVMRGGTTNVIAPPLAPTRTPPSSAAVKKSVGNTTLIRRARLAVRRFKNHFLSRKPFKGLRSSAERSVPF